MGHRRVSCSEALIFGCAKIKIQCPLENWNYSGGISRNGCLLKTMFPGMLLDSWVPTDCLWHGNTSLETDQIYGSSPIKWPNDLEISDLPRFWPRQLLQNSKIWTRWDIKRVKRDCKDTRTRLPCGLLGDWQNHVFPPNSRDHHVQKETRSFRVSAESAWSGFSWLWLD